jgi:cytochrome b6-f complex iron-sulfur subunit
MNRRTFISTCCKAGLAGVFIPSIISSCTSIYYAQHTQDSNIITIKKSEFISKEKNGNSAERKFVVVRSEKLQFPICLYPIGNGFYSAILMECTHKSCELTPHGDYLICPCHGSEFNKLGQVQNPPAEMDLPSFKITTDNEHIYIQL